MFDIIDKKRKFVQRQIQKSFESGINVVEEVELEKAHKDGDIHPKHPNWVWVSSAAGGKGDWRIAGGRTHKKAGASSNDSGKVDIRKIHDAEFRRITNILEKKNPDTADAARHLEEEAMTDSELKNFYACAEYFKNNSGINKLTQDYCKKWAKLARQELEYRKKQKAIASNSKNTPSSNVKTWDKLDDFNKKGSDENNLWNAWYKYQKSGDPSRISEFRNILEKKFPKVAEWKQTSPNTGKAVITAKDSNGKDIASIDLSGDKVILSNLQTFMDKCYDASKKSDDKKVEAKKTNSVYPTGKYFDRLNELLEKRGYYAVQKNNSAHIYKKGDRQALKNLKAAVNANDYIDWGGNENLKPILEPIINQAFKDVSSNQKKNDGNDAWRSKINKMSATEKLKYVSDVYDEEDIGNEEFNDIVDEVIGAGTIKKIQDALKDEEYDDENEKKIDFIYECKKLLGLRYDHRDKIAQKAGYKDYEEMSGYQNYITKKNLLKKPSMRAKSKSAERKQMEAEVAQYEKDHANVIKKRESGK